VLDSIFLSLVHFFPVLIMCNGKRPASRNLALASLILLIPTVLFTCVIPAYTIARLQHNIGWVDETIALCAIGGVWAVLWVIVLVMNCNILRITDAIHAPAQQQANTNNTTSGSTDDGISLIPIQNHAIESLDDSSIFDVTLFSASEVTSGTKKGSKRPAVPTHMPHLRQK
jgi:hypothetical protein